MGAVVVAARAGSRREQAPGSVDCVGGQRDRVDAGAEMVWFAIVVIRRTYAAAADGESGLSARRAP